MRKDTAYHPDERMLTSLFLFQGKQISNGDNYHEQKKKKKAVPNDKGINCLHKCMAF